MDCLPRQGRCRLRHAPGRVRTKARVYDIMGRHVAPGLSYYEYRETDQWCDNSPEAVALRQLAGLATEGVLRRREPKLPTDRRRGGVFPWESAYGVRRVTFYRFATTCLERSGDARCASRWCRCRFRTPRTPSCTFSESRRQGCTRNLATVRYRTRELTPATGPQRRPARSAIGRSTRGRISAPTVTPTSRAWPTFSDSSLDLSNRSQGDCPLRMERRELPAPRERLRIRIVRLP